MPFSPPGPFAPQSPPSPPPAATITPAMGGAKADCARNSPNAAQNTAASDPIAPCGRRPFCSIARRSAMVGHSITTWAGGRPSAGAVRGVMADLLRRVAETADVAAFRELYQAY